MRRVIAGILAPVIAFIGFYLWGRTHPYTVTRSIEIAAPADRVWAILTDLRSYGRWNPEITVANGQVVADGALLLRMRGRSGYWTLHRVVRVADPGRELRWSGHYRDVSGLGEDEHRFTVEAAGPGRVRFTQAETFRGIVIPFIHGTLNAGCSEFDAMNAALKTRAESGK
jgi:hypothetical protein